MSGVLVWQTVTVLCARTSMSAIGSPTTLDRPTTVARDPVMFASIARKISMPPAGVAGGIAEPSPAARRPRFVDVAPSTSFSGATASAT